jgi:ParB family transcriptional regulator, chromosome partitioning protein
MSIGRGLGALISPTSSRKKQTFETGSGANTERIWQVPVSEIKPDPKQPRRRFSEGELNELADSIKEHGVLQPLLVSELEDGGYQIIAGERRWRAAQIAEQAVVPVIVKKIADQQRLEISLIENIQREDLNPIEEGFAYKRLVEEFGLTQEQVGEKVGKSRPAIANAIRLLGLPEEVQNALITGKISAGQARALLTLSDTKQQLDMLASMLGEKMTVRDLEREVQKKVPGSSRRDPNLSYLEEQLRSALGTKVTLTSKGEKGTIAISYFSKDELKNIIKKITG